MVPEPVGHRDYEPQRAFQTSCVVTSFNCAAFLGEAIESALTQSLSFDQVLVIDDCSTDDSLAVAESYASRVTVVANETNLGVIDNFNKAVSLTDSTFVCLLNGDDRYRPEFLEKSLAMIRGSADIAVVATNMALFGDRAEVVATASPWYVGEDGGFFLWRTPFPPDYRSQIQVGNFIHGCALFRREAYDDVGGYVETERPEDHDLWRRMIAYGWSAAKCDEYLLDYRQHAVAQRNIQHQSTSQAK